MGQRQKLKARLRMCTKYHEAVYCYLNLLSLTIDVENLIKSVNRKWMSNRPEMESHKMGPHVNAVNPNQEAVVSST
jgi:hypothetical protein